VSVTELVIVESRTDCVDVSGVALAPADNASDTAANSSLLMMLPCRV
jgi:hypothetical protein